MAATAKASSQILTVLTWNIEGLKRNVFVLSDILRGKNCSLAFLSEPQAYQSDLHYVSQYLGSDYYLTLNSDDLYDTELPLYKSKAKGGTMVLWQKWLDPYIQVITVTSTAFLPVVLSLPGTKPSVHVALYLPTHGQDTQFVSELASLRNCLDDLNTVYDSPTLYIRGDGNVNQNNINRVNILRCFKDHLYLKETCIKHKTYHHFVGKGKYDSNVDVILHNDHETVVDILCSKECPEINSHHDAIISAFCVPKHDVEAPQTNLIKAPRVAQKRTKVVWSEQGIQDYSDLVSEPLRRIRSTWTRPYSQASMSILLTLTNTVMTRAANVTNKSKILAEPVPNKKKVPKVITIVKNRLNKAHRMYRDMPTKETKEHLRQCRKTYHQTVRAQRLQADVERDCKLYNIMGASPDVVFNFVKSLKSSKSTNIAKLTVGNKTYFGNDIPDGFYDSMSSLKRVEYEDIISEPAIAEKFIDYECIMELCNDNNEIPLIDLEDSTKLLKKIKKNVKDYYSITSLHYINAGDEGLLHFNTLLNSIITDINNASLEELNIAHGLIYYKGHKKDKTSDRSYRNISSCPFLAKALDLYLRDLYLDLWEAKQAATQYQGTGSSHELASLLVTEVVQNSLHVSKQPVYLLALDAQSAFDRCLRQVLVSELYKARVPPAAIKIINTRLASRTTVYEWQGEMMGPATDTTGFEQGGVNSSEFYKLYNNEQLKTAQQSALGVDIGSQVIAAIGQADDVMLVAPSLFNLQLLLTLTEQYCTKFRVKLEPSKTKLLAYFPNKQSHLVDHAMNCHQITINDTPVSQVTECEHVGVIRSTAGNLPNVLNRIAMHKNALHALLPTGIARGCRGNPVASLRLAQTYATPVLLSGLASLCLSKAELKIIDGHYLASLQKLLRIHEKTPRSITYYLAGSLPASAILHQRQLSLFAMICHLTGDPLHQHALHVLYNPEQGKQSWFLQVENICTTYGLPHPLRLLEDPPNKKQLKKLVKLRITEYWHKLLSSEVAHKSSLKYFTPHMHSLTQPHALWRAAGSNSYKVNQSTVLARMISGRYLTESVSRFWTENRQGFCLLPTCDKVVGDLEHLLLHCPALQVARNNLEKMWLDKSSVLPPLQSVIVQILASSPDIRMVFILDPTSMPAIISLYQSFGQLVLDTIFSMTRTYAYNLHRKKLILTGKWPYARRNENNKHNYEHNYSNFVSGDRDAEPGVTGDQGDHDQDDQGGSADACGRTEERVQVATMTRDQTPHASSLTGDDSPGVQLLQEPVICTVGGAINFPHSAKTNLVRDGEHDCTSVAHGNQANSLCFQADHVQRVLGVGDRSPGVCDKLPSTGVESVTADSIDKPQCSEGTLSRSLQEGEQLRCVGRAGGAAVGSGQVFHTHIAENLPRNRQDGVSSLEP